MQPCAHPQTEKRLRTLSNKTTAIHVQCIICGDSVGPAHKKTSITPEELLALPVWDDGLREVYRQMASEHYRQERERQRAEWDAQSPQRKAEYAAYLQSDHWRRLRKQVLERDKYQCQGCLMAEATEVHHLTYAHRGSELLFELVSVCDECHERAHSK